jgi:hypothetical protein
MLAEELADEAVSAIATLIAGVLLGPNHLVLTGLAVEHQVFLPT